MPADKALNDTQGTPIVSFVMSGGVGSRLWPLSREDFPKQFHTLSGQGSMLLKTVRRLTERSEGAAPVYLLASARHSARISQEMSGIDLHGGRPVLEPIGRNTAAAVVLATELTLREHGDSLVLVVPSDHEISTTAQFWQTITAGTQAAENGQIVVFGIRPDKPETGYGYIETGGEKSGVFEIIRFVEKPDELTAQSYIEQGNFLWNAGIFLFRASTMREAFRQYAPQIWDSAIIALDQAVTDISGTYLPHEAYADVPSISVDYAIMEKTRNIALVPAQFRWSDLGSWQSLLDASHGSASVDENGNVLIGDVVAIDCHNSYLRSDGRLLSAVGLSDMAVVATADAAFVAPVSQSQNVRKVVEQLERSGRLETRFTPAPDAMPIAGAYAARVKHWLFEETLPLWSTAGVDRRYGGFYEALSLHGEPIEKIKRTRTMARQIYAFSVAKEMGWDGPANELIGHGLQFMTANGRNSEGGWVKTFYPDGGVLDATQDCYDQSFMLLALAHAYRAGHGEALQLAQESFAFIDANLADRSGAGFYDTPSDKDNPEAMRHSNPHMHLLEAFLAWYSVTGEKKYLQRASTIVSLFRIRFFDAESWTLGEYFTAQWQRPEGEKGDWTEPGHHFEWASLLAIYARYSGEHDVVRLARKLYSSAVANGLNRSTGLAYNAVSRHGLPIDCRSRSWPQTEAIKAAIALDGNGGPDLKPEIEARVGRLFRWHIEPAPKGLWIDKIDENGRARSEDVPASIFYHLVCALTQYMDFVSEKLD